MNSLRTHIARLRDERGFTIAYVMLFMLVGSLFAIGAWGAATGDIKATKKDSNSKLAYAAAESGLNYYLYKLNQNNGFWTDCAGGATLPNGEVNPVNDRWDGTGTDPRRFRAMPGNTGASYAIEPLPAAPPPAQCVVGAGAEASMLNPQGELTVRSTGKVGTTKRTVVASMRRSAFLDYLYFTDKETVDPVVYTVKNPAKAAVNCDVYRRDGRPSSCDDIVFPTGDFIKGPLHTNDDILVCGSPTFGRNINDNIEASDPAGYHASSGCSANPNMVGNWQKGVATLQMPPTNAEIKDVALPGYTFKGITRITLNGSSLTVTNAAAGYNNKVLPWPTNGVIYVADNGGCSQPYDIVQDYDDPAGCADAYVKSSASGYQQNLTIASQRDIIVDGNISRNGNVVLGLIAESFVRVYHPVTPNPRATQGSCTTPASSPKNISIDAAILALKHSFIVDNYYCGGTLGTLTVNGAIGQHFRGPVGTISGGSVATGYTKNYNYDDRLRRVNPPYFLDPVNSAWRVTRFNEQVPAT